MYVCKSIIISSIPRKRNFINKITSLTEKLSDETVFSGLIHNKYSCNTTKNFDTMNDIYTFVGKNSNNNVHYKMQKHDIKRHVGTFQKDSKDKGRRVDNQEGDINMIDSSSSIRNKLKQVQDNMRKCKKSEKRTNRKIKRKTIGKQENKKTQETVQNFKPYIIGKVGELKDKLLEYQFHIIKIQSNYTTEDIVTLEDANHTVFIFNSIMSKLKEELSQLQEELKDSYIEWIRIINSCNRTVSNEQDKWAISSNDLEIVGSETTSQNSSYNEIFSTNAYKKQSSNINKSLEKNIWERNNNTILQQNIRQDKNNEISSNTMDTNIINTKQTSNQTGNNNDILQSGQNPSSMFNKLKDTNITKALRTYSTVGKKSTNYTLNKNSSCQNITDTLKQLGDHERVLVQNGPITRKRRLTDYDSDISNKHGIVSLYSSRNMCTQDIKQVDVNEDTYSEDSESLIFEPIPFNNSEVLTPRPDSDERDTFRSNKILDFNIHLKAESNHDSQIVLKKPVALLNTNNSNGKYWIKSTQHKIFNSNGSSVNQIESNMDKKLQMICQVVLHKYIQ
ncbi:GATA zinc finger domain-containing protein 14-like isoform X2 [Bombus vosnesenskii]|uniref:GATA zinc finger domain-containing protein 14-like isoform X2 n=1 Tax=Bombus vosnesenskii TaxID=207650 RepID=A0A6J3L6U4_9HYME|nr:GATA zinc finger domain-containing protein 14-like isoform X2 [Bombus vosnesenskii]